MLDSVGVILWPCEGFKGSQDAEFSSSNFWFKICQQVASDIYSRHSDLSCPSSVPMLEVLWAVTGESIAVFEDEEIADPPASIRQPPSVPAPDAAGNASVNIKAALGAEDWPPTFPTTAPSRQLPTG